MLLGDNRGGRVVIRQLIGFECVAVWISIDLHCIYTLSFDHTYTQL